MTEIDAKAAEEYVRAKWENIESCIAEEDSPSRVDIYLTRPAQHFVHQLLSDCWLAAYNFTLEREQAIREKQEEIAWLVAATAYYGRSSTPAQRILSVLTAQLDDLKRGMR